MAKSSIPTPFLIDNTNSKHSPKSLKILILSAVDYLEYFNIYCFEFQDEREHETVRFHLQQQVVCRHLHNPLPEQEGPLRGED